jgi:thiol-disulfide isomerase/thioredoxin
MAASEQKFPRSGEADPESVEATAPTSPRAASPAASTRGAFLMGLGALAALAVLPRIVPNLLPPQSELVGKPAPDFSLPVAANGEKAGAQLHLAELKGRPVLLDFWSRGCPPCRAVAPTVDRIAKRYEKDGLVVMGVNVDEPAEMVRAYAREERLGYPMVVDEDGSTSRKFGVSRLPSLVIIDRGGNVRSFFVGMMDEAALSEAVAAAM